MSGLRSARFANPLTLLTLIALIIALGTFDSRASARIASVRDSIEAMKTDLVSAVGGDGLASFRDELSLRLDALQSGADFSSIARAYAIDSAHSVAGIYATPASAGDIYARLIRTEAFVRGVERDARRTSLLLRNLLLFLGILFVLVLFRAEIKSRKTLLEAELKLSFSRDVMESIEQERDLIAYELHDTILQKIGFLKQQILERHSDCQRHQVILGMADEAVADVRFLCQNLRKEESDRSLPELLDGLFRNFRTLSSIRLDTVTFGLEDFEPGASTRNHAFRIVQELLTNAHKHSRARVVKLHAFYVPHSLVIVYSDDGTGAQDGMPTTLKSVEFRAKLLNASMKKGVNPDGSGLAIRIEVPIERNTRS